MVKITVQVNGKSVDTDKAIDLVLDHLSKTIIDRATTIYQHKLFGVRCPAHGTEPELILNYAMTGSKLDIALANACCDEFKEICIKKIKE